MTEEEIKEIEHLKTENVFKRLNSVEELTDWMDVYFDIRFPVGVVYPGSTHSPAQAMYRIYELVHTGKSEDIPEIVMLSSRDSGKTLSAAAIAVLCLVHFRLSACILSAITSQSSKTVSYISSFFRKITPYLNNNGWKQNSENTRLIGWITDQGEEIYIKVIVATLAGANSEHTPLLFCDEIDVIANPKALEEAKMIPSSYKGYQPLTVYLSTRKFAGGLMEKTLKTVENAGGEVLRWNIMDITQRITPEEAKIDEPKVLRYVTTELPMSNISPQEWSRLQEKDKNKYIAFEAYAGIAEHPMLPVMRNYLVDRSIDDIGGLYKTVKQTYNLFKKLDTGMADAQLLCNKPSSSGLVYPRFDSIGNVMSVEEALMSITGEKPHNTSFEYLRVYLNNLGIQFIGGADWGYTDYTSLVVLALIPNGDIWLVDAFMQDKIELDDIVKACKELQSKWNISKWYVDQAYPAYIKTLNRNGVSCPEFTKVVADGITALQSRIVDSVGKRRFFIIDSPETKHIPSSFGTYRWALDGKGDVIEGKPYHDSDGISDVMDSIRYPMQNIVGKTGKLIMSVIGSTDVVKKDLIVSSMEPNQTSMEASKKAMSDMITKMATDDKNKPNKDAAGPKRKIMW